MDLDLDVKAMRSLKKVPELVMLVADGGDPQVPCWKHQMRHPRKETGGVTSHPLSSTLVLIPQKCGLLLHLAHVLDLLLPVTAFLVLPRLLVHLDS